MKETFLLHEEEKPYGYKEMNDGSLVLNPIREEYFKLKI